MRTFHAAGVLALAMLTVSAPPAEAAGHGESARARAGRSTLRAPRNAAQQARRAPQARRAQHGRKAAVVRRGAGARARAIRPAPAAAEAAGAAPAANAAPRRGLLAAIAGLPGRALRALGRNLRVRAEVRETVGAIRDAARQGDTVTATALYARTGVAGAPRGWRERRAVGRLKVELVARNLGEARQSMKDARRSAGDPAYLESAAGAVARADHVVQASGALAAERDVRRVNRTASAVARDGMRIAKRVAREGDVEYAARVADFSASFATGWKDARAVERGRRALLSRTRSAAWSRAKAGDVDGLRGAIATLRGLSGQGAGFVDAREVTKMEARVWRNAVSWRVRQVERALGERDLAAARHHLDALARDGRGAASRGHGASARTQRRIVALGDRLAAMERLDRELRGLLPRAPRAPAAGGAEGSADAPTVVRTRDRDAYNPYAAYLGR